MMIRTRSPSAWCRLLTLPRGLHAVAPPLGFERPSEAYELNALVYTLNNLGGVFCFGVIARLSLALVRVFFLWPSIQGSILVD